MPTSLPLLIAPLGISAFLLRGVLRKGGKRKAEEDSKREAEGGVAFSCERVCTSDSLLKRLGSLAKARRLTAACDCCAVRAHALS
jgi:hypothetical protein